VSAKSQLVRPPRLVDYCQLGREGRSLRQGVCFVNGGALGARIIVVIPDISWGMKPIGLPRHSCRTLIVGLVTLVHVAEHDEVSLGENIITKTACDLAGVTTRR
jgi:hypothetical protein